MILEDATWFRSKTGISEATLARFECYADMLRQWSGAINLVAPSTLPEMWRRHFLDSMAVLEEAPASARRWLDLGSGAGFPGAVVAIAASERAPGLTVTCVEADQRKAAFLRSVSRETGVPFRVEATRIERLPPHEADVVSARALAPLPRLLELAVPHLARGGLCLFLKGARHAAEVEEALERWRFTLETCPSKTDHDSAILKIGDPRRA